MLECKVSRVKGLFGGFRDSVLYSCFEGRFRGCVAFCDREDSPESAAVKAGDFCFCAGDTAIAGELAERVGDVIFMPQDDRWQEALTETGGLKLAPRYSTVPPENWDTDRLKVLAAPPEGYELRPIDRELYDQSLEAGWSKAFVGNFMSPEDYLENGLGFALVSGGRLRCAASSFSRYSGGIEVEIACDPEYRRRGLATVCGAALMLGCDRAGLRPHWDAGNLISLRIAEKLGFRPEGEYMCLIRE